MSNKMLPADQTNQSDSIDSVLEVGGRLNSAPSQLMVDTAFNDELKHQLHLMNALSSVDLSHTLSAMELGIIPKESAQKLILALQQLDKEPKDFIPDPAYGDIYTNREAWLNQKTPHAAWLGAGRARREAITTAFFIKLREQLLHLTNSLLSLLDILFVRSENYASAIMPDYTYLQSAQPTTFGHFLLGSSYGVLRDLERLQSAYQHVNLSPAGCGSTAGSQISQNRARLAELMGFEGLFEHCRDAMWPADIPIEVCALATNILINLNRLAEDLMVFNSQEFGLIELSDRHCRASKIMPNKKNPYALTYIRGLSNEVTGNLVSITTMARTPSGQPDSRLTIYGLLPSALEKTSNAVDLFAEVINDLEFNQQRGLQLTNSSLITATDLAETLVLSCEMEFRHAHRVVAKLIKIQGADTERFQNTQVNEITAVADQLGYSIAGLSEKSLQQALDPKLSILAKTDVGGCSPNALKEMIENGRQSKKKNHVWVTAQNNRLENAQLQLECSIEQALKG